jgi:hypothetical protein
MTFWYSDEDWAASEKDATMIKDKVGGDVTFKKVPFKDFGHLDFLWDKRLNSHFYPRVVLDMIKEEIPL